MSGYETSLFGDGVSTTRVETVHNHYGPRDSTGAYGVTKTEGRVKEMTLTFDGTDATAGAFKINATKNILPKECIIEDVYVEILTAFTMTGTSPTILIGTNGSEVTNGVVISEAIGEAVGIVDITSTLTGTWAAGLAAATTVGIAIGGSSSPTATGGVGKIVIRYVELGAK